MKTFLFLILLSSTVMAVDYPTVQKDDFEVGNYWVWAYYEKDKDANAWKAPYLYEKYTVVRVEGDVVTIEMSSDSKLPVLLAAHHKFRVNIQKCLTNYGTLEKIKPWTLEFYTKSFSPQWELASAQHKNLVFTEKFNCVRSSNKTIETVVQTLLGDVSVFKHGLPHWDSYYNSYDEKNPGVAALKYFDKYYKFELVNSFTKNINSM